MCRDGVWHCVLCCMCNIGYKYMKMFLVFMFRCVSWCVDVCGYIASLVVGGNLLPMLLQTSKKKNKKLSNLFFFCVHFFIDVFPWHSLRSPLRCARNVTIVSSVLNWLSLFLSLPSLLFLFLFLFFFFSAVSLLCCSDHGHVTQSSRLPR